jgi:hypothetical protein
VSWKSRETLGEQLVGEVFDLTAPPHEWLLNQPDGFAWWPGEMAQRVWTEDGLYQNGRTYYRVHCETDLVKGRNQREQLDAMLECEMDHCLFSCLVYDQRTDVYRLHTCVYAEGENAQWITKLFHSAARLQLFSAYRMVDKLTQQFHSAHATSAHPVGGLREDRDPRVNQGPDSFIAAGQQPSRWVDADEWRDVDWAMDRQAHSWQKSDKRSSLSHFYWAADTNHTIELLITAEEPHPIIGNGLHFTLTVPLKMSPKHVAYMALELNEHERSTWLKTHMLGSWCNHNGALSFRLFVPNTLYQEGVLHELSVSMAGRANWTNEYFYAKKVEAERARQPSKQG